MNDDGPTSMIPAEPGWRAVLRDTAKGGRYDPSAADNEWVVPIIAWAVVRHYYEDEDSPGFNRGVEAVVVAGDAVCVESDLGSMVDRYLYGYLAPGEPNDLLPAVTTDCSPDTAPAHHS